MKSRCIESALLLIITGCDLGKTTSAVGLSSYLHCRNTATTAHCLGTENRKFLRNKRLYQTAASFLSSVNLELIEWLVYAPLFNIRLPAWEELLLSWPWPIILSKHITVSVRMCVYVGGWRGGTQRSTLCNQLHEQSGKGCYSEKDDTERANIGFSKSPA